MWRRLSSETAGKVRNRALLAVVAAVAAVALSPNSDSITSARASGIEYAKPVSNRLNVTGRAVDLPVVLKDGDAALGEVVIRINADDTVLIHKSGLVERLAAVIDGPARARLEAVPAQNAVVTLPALRAEGFDVRFDPGLQELVFRPKVDQRPVGDIYMGYQRGQQVSANLARPALVAGYVNVTAGIDQIWAGTPLVGQPRTDDATIGRLEFESAIRLWNVVVENRAVYRSGAEPNFCPPSIPCLFDDTAGFRRQSTRVVYDQPRESLRWEAGDVDPMGLPMQGSPDMLGVAAQKSPQKLNPGDSARSTGRSSFRVEQPSQVDVLVNGVVLQRLQLRPGIYNIRDLPLATGANDVQLEITDDAGDKRTLHFRLFFDGSLLAASKDEWGLSAGVPSYLLNEQRFYSDSQYMGTAYYRYGLTDSLTLETHAQGDNYVGMGGVGALMQTPLGIFGLRGALSSGDVGAGGSAAFDWSLVNFSGLIAVRGESLRLSVEYRSPDFRVPGEVVVTADNLPYLRPNYRLRFDASYSAPLPWGVTATAGMRYLMLDDEQAFYSPFALRHDRYGADLTFSRAFGPTLSGSLTLGYSNETYFHSLFDDRDERPEFRVAVRLSFRPDSRTSIAAGYDTLNRHADVSAYRSEGNGIGRWDVSVSANNYELDDRTGVGGAINYTGNRAEVRASHSAGLAGFAYDRFGWPTDQRTTLRVGSSLAFADGHVAVGAPIRGGAFAIVYPHASLAAKEITVGSNLDVRAKADGWGPAVVTSIPAYQHSTLPIDVDDLPIGYSLGAAAFDTYAPYKAGYSLEVGSANSVYAYGTLLQTGGEPVALLTGVARPAAGPGKPVTIFTNGSGKFGAEGLAPGRWIIDMATPDRPTRYEIDIPAGTDGLFKAGTLSPVRRT